MRFAHIFRAFTGQEFAVVVHDGAREGFLIEQAQWVHEHIYKATPDDVMHGPYKTYPIWATPIY